MFYVQYAHARMCSAQRYATAEGVKILSEAESAELERLDSPEERALMRLVADWPRRVEEAALAHEPHRIAFALRDTAAAFHALWNRGNEDAALRFVPPGPRAQAHARLTLVKAARAVIAAGLSIMGVAPVEEMR